MGIKPIPMAHLWVLLATHDRLSCVPGLRPNPWVPRIMSTRCMHESWHSWLTRNTYGHPKSYRDPLSLSPRAQPLAATAWHQAHQVGNNSGCNENCTWRPETCYARRLVQWNANEWGLWKMESSLEFCRLSLGSCCSTSGCFVALP